MASTAFEDATRIDTLSSHEYHADLSPEWCIGTVPHGGYVTSLFMKVARLHFSTTLGKQDQPHTLSLHLEFLRRTEAGPGHFFVRDMKLGRQTSTIHVSLTQDGREEVIGYITHTHMDRESGLTLQTNHTLSPAPLSVDLQQLKAGKDTHWTRCPEMPFAEFRKAANQVQFYFPRAGFLHRSIGDEWVTFTSGEKFTNDSLGYLSDTWPQLVENYREISPYDVRREPMDETTNGPPVLNGKEMFWYPTLLLNLDVKKQLPEEGVEFLFVRVRAKSIVNGRADLEVVIMDEQGDLVALSHHIAFILPAERNTAARRKTKL